MPCRSVPGGVSQHALQVSPGGGLVPGLAPIFWGGAGVEGGLRGNPQNIFFRNFFLISAFFGDTPPGPDTGIRSTFGRYASYWNAFLL